MQEKKLSVVIITYNQEKYISKTIESIINQKHDYSYEIVIGDDCSKDNTRKVITEYAEKFPEIIKPLFNEKNLGVIGNYFNVLSNCTGKYIMECAGDDYWLPGKVGKQIIYMEHHPSVGLCYGKAFNYYQTTDTFSKKALGGAREKYNALFLGNTIPALSVCFRNELVKKYLIDVNPLQKDWRLEDLPMWLWFAKNSKIKFINKPIAVYRVLEESESHSNDTEKYQLYAKSCRDVRAFYSELYNEKYLLDLYDCNDRLNKAWASKNKEQIILNGKNVLKIKFSIRVVCKILLAKCFLK